MPNVPGYALVPLHPEIPGGRVEGVQGRFLSSWVWNVFAKDPHTPQRTICRICHRSYDCKGSSTSAMGKHIERVHREIYLTLKSRDGPASPFPGALPTPLGPIAAAAPSPSHPVTVHVGDAPLGTNLPFPW